MSKLILIIILNNFYNDIGFNCLNFKSFSQRGAAKAKSAVESARARQTKLMATQKAENKFLADFVEWLPQSDSRPSSGLYLEIKSIIFLYLPQTSFVI